MHYAPALEGGTLRSIVFALALLIPVQASALCQLLLCCAGGSCASAGCTNNVFEATVESCESFRTNYLGIAGALNTPAFAGPCMCGGD